MDRSFLLLALVAAFGRPALAHDCPCECPVQADAQKIPNEEIFVSEWQQEAPPTVSTPTTYAPMQDIHVGTDGVINIAFGEATPGFLIDRALDEKGIQNEWLAPLACVELDRVEDALYARHLVDFENDADETFFAVATVGVYRPVPHLTREGAERFFTSQDRLTLLRVDRAQINKDCKEKR